MTSRERRWGLVIAFASLAASMLDTIALVGVMPLVSLIIEPSVVSSNRWIAMLHGMLGAPQFTAFVTMVALGSIALITASLVANFIVMIAIKRYRVSCQNRLARELISMCVRAPYKWLLRQNSVALAHNVFNDVLSWATGINGILSAIGQISLLALVVAVLIQTAGLIGLLAIAITGLLAGGVMLAIRPKVRDLSVLQRVTKARSAAFASEFLSGIKDIKLSGRGYAFVDVYQRSFHRYGDAINTLKIVQAIPPLSLQFLGQVAIISIALILWLLGASSGEIASAMALVLLVTARAIPTTIRLVGEIGAIWAAIPSIDGIKAMRNEIIAESGGAGKDKLDPARFAGWRRMELAGAGYQYSQERGQALRDVTAVIERGKSYGIVGPTGAGKTTLIDLILGLLQPTSGEIRIDGVSFKPEDASSWQAAIGYVPQSPMIADASLVENVALGVRGKEIDRAQAMRCLEQANLKDVAESVGLDGQLGERGNQLSGGQRQRVAIARALYDKPSVLVLDEATSALDTLSERAVHGAIENIHGEVTTIIIAHRLSTVQGCDEIFVLDRGALVARGTFAELLKTSPLFQQLASVSPSDEMPESVATIS